jgi:hypothetical protein
MTSNPPLTRSRSRQSSQQHRENGNSKQTPAQEQQQQHAPTAWQKVLWKKQPFADNYTDSSFLQHLVRDIHVQATGVLHQSPNHPNPLRNWFLLQVVNADVPERDLWTVVLGSAAVSQQLATVVAAVSVPVHLRMGLMTGHTLLLLNVLMLLTGEPGLQTHATQCCADLQQTDSWTDR